MKFLNCQTRRFALNFGKFRDNHSATLKNQTFQESYRKERNAIMSSLIIFLSVLFSIGALNIAQASCGTATCPLNTNNYLQAGWLQLGLVREYIDQNQFYVGSSKASLGAFRQPDQEHDEVQTTNIRSIIKLQAGFTNRLSFAATLPFIHREHVHISLENDEWESWNFSALGDMVISGQYAILLPPSDFKPYLSILLGAKLPSGVTDAINADGEKAEVSLQPGTGSYDALFGFNFRQRVLTAPTLSGDLFATMPLNIGITYRVNGKGNEDWRFGNTLIASVGTSYQMVKHASLLLQINGKFQKKADPGMVSITDSPPGNTGGKWIFASPGLSIQLNDSFSAYSYVQLPIYQDVNGIQQTAPYYLQFGLTFSTGLLQ